MKSSIQTRKAGFSLIEVTLALGVAGFCLLAIFGLLPVGVNSNKIAVEQSEASNLALGVITDLQAADKSTGISPRFNFTVPNATGSATTTAKSTVQVMYFDRYGTALGKVGTSPGPPPANVTSDSVPFFRVSVGYAPPTTKFNPPPINNTTDPSSYTKGATSVRIAVTWPALGDRKLAWPTSFAGSFETVTALNRN